ncbi:MAG: hypothetical protein GY936_12575 [Ignavibacteriae bacterium]|nr:hypothetical protein [Ignavibacteriota bacterium]
MKDFIKFSAYQQNKKLSLVFLYIFVVLAILASIIGISDNPSGIIILYLGIASLILSFIHHWQSTRKFIILLTVIIITFVISAILHNLLEVVAEKYITLSLLKELVSGLGVLFFIVAVLICPPAILISIIGAVKFAFKKSK